MEVGFQAYLMVAFLTHSQAMIDEFDLDQDGEISEAEFVRLFLPF
jgi:hypothetical protein